MVVSFLLPWWSGDVISFYGEASIDIYGWGIPDQESFIKEYMLSDITPSSKVTLSWVFLSICVVTAILGSWLGKKARAMLLGISGVGILAYSLVAYFIVIAQRLSDYSIKPRGESIIESSGMYAYSVRADIGLGFYLACITGCVLVILALIEAICHGLTKRIPQEE